jgi:hypothetical protein
LLSWLKLQSGRRWLPQAIEGKRVSHLE